MVEIAEDIIDIGIKPSDVVQNPKKVLKKGLGLIELMAGSMLSGFISAPILNAVKNETVADLIQAGIGMIGSQAIGNADISNIVSGLVLNPVAKLGAKIWNMISAKTGINIPPAASPISANDMSLSTEEIDF